MSDVIVGASSERQLLSVGFSRAPSFCSSVFSLMAVSTRPATLWLSVCGVFMPDVALRVCVCLIPEIYGEVCVG